jgi:hypothetical protein
MPVFIFKGDAWPKGDKVSSPNFVFGWDEDSGGKARMSFEMRDSEITIQCNSTSADRNDPNSIGQLIGMVDLFSKVCSRHHRVYVSQWIYANTSYYCLRKWRRSSVTRI